MPLSFSIKRHPFRRRKQPGLAPGTLVYPSEAPPGPVRIRVCDYDDRRMDMHEVAEGEAFDQYRDRDTVTWIDVDGVHDTALVEAIGTAFGIHPLTLEDVVGTHQRPKAEDYPSYVYVVLQMMHFDEEQDTIEAEQVSLVFGDGFLLSFQESSNTDLFEPIRRRLQEHRGRIRSAGADYLAYALIDIIVDYFMDLLERLGEHIELLEDTVTTTPDPEVTYRINRLRRQVILLRRSVWPLRDVITALERSQLSFIAPETGLFLRDTYDHAIRTAEMIESAREILASLTDLHVSMISFRSNEIMKVLTIIATIFLPLTFIAGVYGMNFNPRISPFNMPELDWYFGYPLSLGLMLAVAGGMYAYFRRKGWL